MPDDVQKEPELREIAGALILGADHPIPAREIRKVIEAVAADRRAELAAETGGENVSDEELLAADAAASADKPEQQDGVDGKKTMEIPPEDDSAVGSTGIDGRAIKAAVVSLQEQFAKAGLGMNIVEVAGGYRLQTSPECGPWVRRMLNRGKPARISRPMIETLAIIAYRQPISRSEIESIRGVGVGHVIKALMEVQLVRIIGRSELPGRPFLFGTTTTFLDHFGLKDLNELNAMQPGVERTPVAEQRARHFKLRMKGAGSTPDSGAGYEPEEPVYATPQPELPFGVSAGQKSDANEPKTEEAGAVGLTDGALE